MLRQLFSIETAVEAVIRFRLLWLTILLFLTIGFVVQLPNLVLDGSMERIMLKDDPERAVWERSVELFGSDELVAVAIPYPETVWNEDALHQLAEVTAAIREIEDVKQIDSLSSSLVVRRMIIPRAKTIVEWFDRNVPVDELRLAALRDPTVRKNLVSDDGKNVALMIRLSPQATTTVGLKKQIIYDIREVLNARLGEDNFYITGWPVVHVEIADYMQRDLTVLIPLVVLVVALLLAITFQRVAGVLLPLSTIGLAQIWTMGGLVATGRSISMVTNSLPVIIVAIGTTFCIHVVSQIFRALPTQPNQTAAIRIALRKTAPSILLSAITTIIGFAALKFSPVDSIDEFGMFAVWGIAASAMLAVVFLPCLALTFPLAVQPAKTSRFHIDPRRFVRGVLSKRRIVWIVSGLVIVISAWGLSRIQVETAPVSWFPADSETRRSVKYLNDNLAGMTPFNVVLDFEDANRANQLENLRRIEQLQQWLAEQPEVDTTLSIADPLKVVYRSTGRGRHRLVLPGDQQRVDKVLRIVRGGSIAGIDALINQNASAANIIIRSSEVSTQKSTAFAKRVNVYLAENFSDAKLARITGSAYLSYRTNEFFTNGLAISLSIGMAGISLVMILLFRSFKLGLLAMVPNVLPVMVNYAILGLCNLNLNSATSITGCIAIGIAVDDTIHFLMAFRGGLKRGREIPSAIEFALAEVGRPMLVTTVVLSLGFSVLLMSSFSPVNSLGMLVAIAMFACLICDTLFLPVLLTARVPGFLRRFGRIRRPNATPDTTTDKAVVAQ